MINEEISQLLDINSQFSSSFKKRKEFKAYLQKISNFISDCNFVIIFMRLQEEDLKKKFF